MQIANILPIFIKITLLCTLDVTVLVNYIIKCAKMYLIVKNTTNLITL